MGVPVDDAVGFRKETPERMLNIGTQAGAMRQANGKWAQGKLHVLRMAGAGILVAHVAADRIHGPVMENLQDRKRRQIAGMDDDITIRKTLRNLPGKQVIGSVEMRVGQNACANH
jgi:hypothetical protein